jgi:glycosyltransferase involved in cell wall biosynthesis
VEWLAAQATLPAAVIINSGYTPYLRQILPWCQRNRVRLLFDAVEWYEPERRWGYLTSPYQWNIEYAMRWLIPKVDGVIAISRYLADYYGTRGLPVAIVPPTTSAISPGPWKADACLRLCYAGNPGHKDDLGGILRAVANLAEKGAPIQLTVAGPTRSEVFRLIGQQDGPDIPWLRTPGMLEHGEVQRLVGSADFSILARQPSRTAQAGFPTKFVESFASGTPVIANLTSDLHLHLRDGETGLVCALPDADSIAAAVTRALALDGNALSRMRGACSEHARQSFHPSGFADVLYDLIQQEPNK